MRRELVDRCQCGTREAYAVLTRRHARLVFAACLGTLGHVSESDLTAETVSPERLEQLEQSKPLTLDSLLADSPLPP